MRRVDANEQAIRDLYDARARRDWDTVRSLLADEVGYHEPGEEDHSGDYRGRDEVVALLEKLVAVTEGTFQLEPEAFLNLQQHSAVLVRWWAERQGRRSDGYEIAVYRVSDGKIAEVWFYNEPSDAESFSAVFAYD
jgi:ketosteroid isomerase-like protein